MTRARAASRRSAPRRCPICGTGKAGKTGGPCRGCLAEPPWRDTILRFIAAEMKLNELRRHRIARQLSTQMRRTKGRLAPKKRQRYSARMREQSLKQRELAKLWSIIEDRSLAKHVSRMERHLRATGQFRSPVQPTKFLGAETDEKPKRCPCCATKMLVAPGLGPYCPNKECDVLDGADLYRDSRKCDKCKDREAKR